MINLLLWLKGKIVRGMGKLGKLAKVARRGLVEHRENNTRYGNGKA